MRKYWNLQSILFLTLPFLWTSCSQKETGNQLFTEVSEAAGIEFENNLFYTEEFNPYTYRNFYNGAGVALGDINNDGLLDIYLTGNLTNNKLYLNKGNWKFEDISTTAGVTCPHVWSSGATFADINGDGFLDLYVCKSGKPEGENRHNELFINNGDNTFTEKSKEYNLDIIGLSTHAAFFDYDKDGDLDVYILTNSIRSVGVGYDLIKDQREIPDPNNSGNKFMRNDEGVFYDATLETGIYSSTIGFGLGITLGDFNKDSWTDIFISNDFFERDYLYINDTKGGFTEEAETYFKALSMGSMGADVGDMDNDGNLDLIVTEMLPTTIERKRTKALFESWDKYNVGVSKGYFYQFPRNVLQRNSGDNQFLEVGRFSDVAATEWSWGALLFDMDNDGLKDIFVSNGVCKDLLDRDYLTYMANEEQVKLTLKKKGAVIKELIDVMPSLPVANAVYQNKGGFNFENKAKEWGFEKPTFSNGSAYGDLDNDGDLDLVVNNINMPSFVYRNNTDTLSHRSIHLQLKGAKSNTFAIGARVEAWANGTYFYAENFPSRGFQSSVEPSILLGLGDVEIIDSLKISWNTGGVTSLKNIKTNQTYIFEEKEKQSNLISSFVEKQSFIKKHKTLNTSFKHQENNFVDFDRERLLFQMYSNEGPHIAVADVDNDGKQDFFIGNAKKNIGALFKQNASEFDSLSSLSFAKDAISEDGQTLFFDCDQDGDMDLYVASSGRAFGKSSSALRDRIYINDGNGNFTKEEKRLPFVQNFSTGTVSAGDYDQDGDLDLFVGERFHPFYYGTKGQGFILENDGKGFFQDVSAEVAPSLESLGMMTDSKWADLNGDGFLDLVVVGDWMGVKLFINQNGKLSEESENYNLGKTKGWWNCVEIVDFDRDGDLDIIAGNHGTNSFFKAGMRMYRGDFDENGTAEHLICEERNGKYYPISDKDELIKQLPYLKKKMLYYSDYASASMTDLFDATQIETAEVFDTDILQSIILINDGKSFSTQPLPSEAQYSPTYAIKAADLNKDGYIDLILGGNQYMVKPQYGRFDASKGLVLMGSKSGYNSNLIQFLDINGQVRDIEILEKEDKKIIIFAINGKELEFYETMD